MDDKRLRAPLSTVIQYPLPVIAVLVLLCGLCLNQLFNIQNKSFNLEIDPSTESILPQQDQDKIYFDQLKTKFASGSTVLIALVDENIFTTDNLNKIQLISDEIERLEYVQRVSSLSLAINIRSDDEELLVEPFYYDVPTTPQALDELKHRAINDPIYGGNLISADGRIAIIAVSLLDEPEKILLQHRVSEKVRAVAQSEWQHGDVWVSGNAHISAEMTKIMFHDLVTIIPIALVIMSLIALVSFRSIRGVLIPVAIMFLSVVFTLAFIQQVFGSLNQVTIAVPALLIVIGFAYAIHVMSSYYEAAQLSVEHRSENYSPVIAAFQNVSAPVIYAGLTTGIGFLSLTISDLSAIQQFGIASGIGIFITVLVTLTLAPACLQLLAPPKIKPTTHNGQPFLDTLFEKLAKFDSRFWKYILITGSLVCLLSIVTLPNIRISSDMISSFRVDSQIRQDFTAINKNLQGANSFYVVLEANNVNDFKHPNNLAVIESFQLWLSRQTNIGGSTSLVDYLKVIHQGLNGGSEYFSIPATYNEVDALVFVGSNDEFDDVVDFDYQIARISVRTSAKNSEELLALKEHIDSHLQKSLPSHINGRVTGTSILVAQTMDDIAIGQVLSIATAFIIIYFVLVILFTSFSAGFIALVPNLIPVLLYFGILSWSGIDLNVMTGLVACIVLGIAVDDTIHLMAHFNKHAKLYADEAKGIANTLHSVGRPITYTTCALCLGFLSMLSSDMQSQAEFGLLAAATLVGAWIVDVTFTPAIAGRMKIVSLWDVLNLDLGESPHTSIPLFTGLSATQARIAALMAHIEEYKANDTIFSSGDKGRYMYVVIEGRVNVSLQGDDNDHTKTIHLKTMERGEVLGEVALFHDVRTATAQAESDLRLLAISRNDLNKIQKRYPKISAQLYANLIGVFAGRVANLTSKIS